MAEKTYDVVGIGNAIVDIIARCDDGFLTKHDLDKGFMRLIDADEAARLYEAMGPAIERSGGSVANSIAGLASFGAECGFIGRVAADQFGGIFRHDIRSQGIDYSTEPAQDGAPTARCLVLVTPDGERTMNTFLGASVDFAPADMDAEMIGAARIVDLEGYLFDKEAAKAAFREAAKLAKAAGAKKAGMAPAAEVERSSGYVLGGVSPLGQKRQLPTFIDQSAKDFTEIYISAGRRGLEVALRPLDLQAALGAHFAELGQA